MSLVIACGIYNKFATKFYKIGKNNFFFLLGEISAITPNPNVQLATPGLSVILFFLCQ
jgi:hypothetical protein